MDLPSCRTSAIADLTALGMLCGTFMVIAVVVGTAFGTLCAGPLVPRNTGSLSGRLIAFDQTEFAPFFDTAA